MKNLNSGILHEKLVHILASCMKNLNLGVRGNINQKAFEFQLLLD
jgi:hypothetical protein